MRKLWLVCLSVLSILKSSRCTSHSCDSTSVVIFLDLDPDPLHWVAASTSPLRRAVANCLMGAQSEDRDTKIVLDQLCLDACFTTYKLRRPCIVLSCMLCMNPATSFPVNILWEQQEVCLLGSHWGSHTDDALLNQDHGIEVEITHARRECFNISCEKR